MPRAFVCSLLLFRVVELKIVDADRITVFDPLLFQAVKEAALAQLAVKVHAGLIIVEVDIVQELLEPLSGHDPQIVIAFDPEVVRVSSLRQRRY